MKDILTFLSRLAENNNREWFAAHKDEYLHAYSLFLDFGQRYLDGIKLLEPEMADVQVKDCVWRIYRDTRFSLDKTPYKIHFGIFAAAHGGRHSQHGGYYVHIQPGHCLFSGGIWNPSKELLRALRQEVFVNYEEVEEIFHRPDTRRYFTDFDDDMMLRRVPSGFLADFVHADWLKRQSYTFTTPLTDAQVCDDRLVELVLERAKAAKPLNDFLNYTFEQYGDFPKRCR